MFIDNPTYSLRRFVMLRRWFTVLLLCTLVPTSLIGCEIQEVQEDDMLLLGEGEAKIILDENETRYVAGFKSGLAANGIADLPRVKAVSIRQGNKLYMLLSVDCIALASGTVDDLRDCILNELPEHAEIHIVSTHNHAGPDTLGLWGLTGIDGKNEHDMESLKKAAAAAGRTAYDDMRGGKFYFSSVDCTDMIEDTRKPIVFDGNAYVFRFAPNDGSVDTRLILFPSHAESLGGDNTEISADFPAYIAKTISEKTGGRALYFPGAIGGLLRTVTLSEDSTENFRLTGEKIAERILSNDTETPLDSTISIYTEKVNVSCDNTLFRGMKFLGVLENKVTSMFGNVNIQTTVSLLRIGDKKILLLPGEIFPELVYGTDPTFVPVNKDKEDPVPLTDILGDDLLVIGLCDDEIGYIVPPSDFLLDENAPYLTSPPRDSNGENHYEETNSAGENTAWAIEKAVRKLAGLLG